MDADNSATSTHVSHVLICSIDDYGHAVKSSAASTPQRSVSVSSGSYRGPGLMPHVAYQCVLNDLTYQSINAGIW